MLLPAQRFACHVIFFFNNFGEFLQLINKAKLIVYFRIEVQEIKELSKITQTFYFSHTLGSLDVSEGKVECLQNYKQMKGSFHLLM